MERTKKKNLMKKYLLFSIAPLLVIACQNKNNNSSNIVGNDKDSHGCIASAGYRWSVVQNKCVRPWEESIQLHAVQNAEGAETAAFALTDSSKQKMEVFVPEVDTLILDKVSPALYAKGDYQLVEEDHCWSLRHEGKTVYAERK